MSRDDPSIEFESYPERPLAEVERLLEELIARGEIVAERATAEDLARAQVPASAGAAFMSLARRFRSITLAAAEVRIDLHRGEVADDELGGWRLGVDPAEIDLRLALPPAGEPTTDLFYDATWSPRGSGGVVRHSTAVHFIVRAAVGDGD